MLVRSFSTRPHKLTISDMISGMFYNGLCASMPSTAITVIRNTGAMGNGGLPMSPSTLIASAAPTSSMAPQYSTITNAPEWIFAYPVVVAWQEIDLSVISPQMIHSPALQSVGSFTSNGESLSLAMKIGIGLGAPLAISISIAIIWVALWRQHRKKRLAKRAASATGNAHGKAELPAAGRSGWDHTATELDKDNGVHEADIGNILHECDGWESAVEADSAHSRVELDTGWRGWEAPVGK